MSTRLAPRFSFCILTKSLYISPFFLFLFLFRRALCRSPFLFLTSGRIIALCFSFSFPTICFCLHQCLQLFYVSVVTVYISIMFLFLFYFYLCFSGRFLVVPPRMGRIFGLKFLFLYTSIFATVSVSVVSVYIYIYISIYTLTPPRFLSVSVSV